MAEGFSWEISENAALLVNEADLRNFMDNMASKFSEIEFVGEFFDGVKLSKATAAELLPAIAAQDRKLVSVKIRGTATTTPPDRYKIIGNIYMTIGSNDNWWTARADLSRNDESFFKIKDDIEQFLKNCQPWYSVIHKIPLWALTVAWLVATILIIIAEMKIALLVADKIYTEPIVSKWLKGVGASDLIFVIGLAGFVSNAVINRASNVIYKLFPKSVILIGSEKRRYESMRDVRKWVLGALATAFLSCLWLVIGLKR